jgi:hypothetical protein
MDWALLFGLTRQLFVRARLHVGITPGCTKLSKFLSKRKLTQVEYLSCFGDASAWPEEDQLSLLTEHGCKQVQTDPQGRPAT